jgi:hypothetical protein
MKRPKPGLVVGLGSLLAYALILLVGSWLLGCSSVPRESIRLDKDPAQLTQEAGCQPLPACHISPGATSTQLEAELWACLLEARAQVMQCFHLVHGEEVPK